MKNYVKSGKVLTVKLTAPVKSGDLVVVGSAFGIASCDGAVDDEIEVALGGVYELPKASAQAWTLFALLYWDAAAGNVTTVANANTKIGVAAEIAANPSAIGRVRLNDAF